MIINIAKVYTAPVQLKIEINGNYKLSFGHLIQGCNKKDRLAFECTFCDASSWKLKSKTWWVCYEDNELQKFKFDFVLVHQD